MIFIYTNII